MDNTKNQLLRSNLKQLRLPTMLTEYSALAKEASNENVPYAQYLLKLTELEVTTRLSNALARRIKQADFPVEKVLSDYDFSALPSLNKQKILELSRCEWLAAHRNSCLIGSTGVGKTHLAIALGLSACQRGYSVRFYTAADLVNHLEVTQKTYQLDKFLRQLAKVDLLICDELGYLSFSRSGSELLFRILADRYERGSTLITSNLPFSEWGTIFQGERMTAALLDRLTHHCDIFEMNGDSYRFKESVKMSKGVAR